MADVPDLWTERMPATRPLFDRRPAFGLSRAAGGMPPEAPPALVTTEPRMPEKEHGPFLTYLCLPWSYGDRGRTLGDLWHRLQCRRERHQVHGGHVAQVGGAVVFVERRCRWCGAEAGGALRS